MDSAQVRFLGFVVAGAVVYEYLTRRKHKFQGSKKGPNTLDAVGGHGSKQGKGDPILVQGNKILKPFQPSQGHGRKNRGELEADFYRDVTIDNHPIKDFIPKYFGIEELTRDGKKSSHLVLENLLYGLSAPCICDLKMGQQTYDEDARPEKIEREKQKYPPQEIIGFRIVGMKVTTAKGDIVFKSTREWCMQRVPENMASAIETFFFDGHHILFDLVEALVKKLEQIEAMLRKYPTWRMYGSSLLLAYDAKNPTPETLRVRMIDFAHVFPIRDKGMDEGYLHGIRFLKGCLVYILNKKGSGHQGQVGGHGNVSSSGGTIVKLEDKPEQFDVEVKFYKEAAKTHDPLERFMPRLISVNEYVSPRELTLSDATLLCSHNPEAVSLMDIKLGLRSFRSDAPNNPESRFYNKYASFVLNLKPSRASQVWESMPGVESVDGPLSLASGQLGKRDYLTFRDATTTSLKYGYRLTGLRHHDYQVTQAESRNIETQEQFFEKVEHFLSTPYGFNLPVANSFLKELVDIQTACQNSKMFAEYEMVGSSLLFIYSGDKAAIQWIDFANCIKRPCEDHNGVLFGIQNLIEVFSALIDKMS